MSRSILFDEMPLRPFHIRLAAGATGGLFSDGFVLGIIGIATSVATIPLGLSALWIGMLAASSLIGLFIGCIIAGQLVDHYGRRVFFRYNMLVFALISVMQYFANSATELMLLRLALGITLGADYVVSKAILIEFSPKRSRGRLLSALSIAWACGYVSAYFVGFLLRDTGDNAWRMMLASSAAPALAAQLFRLGTPESPLWLLNRGCAKQALEISRRLFGNDVTLPAPAVKAAGQAKGWRALASCSLRVNTFVGCVFFTCQVVPYFALGTFAPTVLRLLSVKNGFTGAIVYNGLLLIGALIGMAVVDHVGRRSFLVWTFYASALLLAALTFGHFGEMSTVLLFGLFACILSASANLEAVYTPELFPTEVRGVGVGFVIAVSRIGSAASTFLLPLSIKYAGIMATLGVCVAVLAFGGTVCLRFAPETRGSSLEGSGANRNAG